MPRKCKGTGDRALDVEIDALWAEVDRLSKAKPSQTVTIPETLTPNPGGIRVENVSADFFVNTRGLTFDDTDGIELTEEGDHVRVDLLPTIVRKNSAGSEYTRRRLNLIEGSNITLTVADDSTDNEVDVTIAGASGAQVADYTDDTNTTINYTTSSAGIDVLTSTNASAVTVNLPTAVGKLDHIIVVKRMGAVNSVVVDPNSSETIDGASTKTLGSQYATIGIISDNANWLILFTYGTVT